MGLLNIFKKKHDEPVTLEIIENKVEPYDPWKRTTLPRNDNYATAAFVSMSRYGAKIGSTNDDYARYFSYDFRVYDPIKYHKKVIEEGYLVEAAPDIALKKFKVDQLKAILINANLPDKGKKDILISRIIENVNIDSLNLDKYYVPSEKGLEHLEKYDYVFSLRNYGISWEEYDNFRAEFPNYFKPNDIIWRMLNDRFNYHNMGKDYGLARNELHYMAKLLESEKKYVDALCYYTLVLYYDTSGLSNNNHLMDIESISIAPGLVEPIHRLKEHYDSRIIERCYDRFRLPRHYITRKNFEKLLFDIFEDETIDIRNYIK